MKDPYVFGRSPAALYLRDLLVELNDDIVSNRVGSLLNDAGMMANDLISSMMTPMTILTAARLMTREFRERAVTLPPKIQNVAVNVAMAKFKSIIRRSTIAAKLTDLGVVTAARLNALELSERAEHLTKIVAARQIIASRNGDLVYIPNVINPSEIDDPVSDESKIQRNDRRRAKLALLEWVHLKPYGYAPGWYTGHCRSCGASWIDQDKRSWTCRPCAEKMHANDEQIGARHAGC